MKKRIYRAVPVKKLNLESLAKKLPRDRITVGVDVAKREMFAVLMASNEELLAVLRWDHLRETRTVVAWLAALPAARLEVAMEPSGTYGDALRQCLEQSGLEVFRVSSKQTKDSCEIYDGVPSSHDAKSAAVVAWLHLLGRSTRWHERDTQRRELTAALQELVMYESALSPALNRLEAQLARYWPELPELLDLDSATLLELLSQFGGPESVASSPQQARALMERTGGYLLKLEKIDQVMQSAQTTLGVSMLPAEQTTLQAMATETRRRQQAVQGSKKRLRAYSLNHPELTLLGQTVGHVTAALVGSELGSLLGYPNGGCLLKAAGLNLKERSSGRRQGQLAITKRGSRRVRQYLYLAVLRWIQKDRLVRAWYEAKVQRDGGVLKRKALVALMRKLLCGLWWVARGERLDSHKLFDKKRLVSAAS